MHPVVLIRRVLSLLDVGMPKLEEYLEARGLKLSALRQDLLSPEAFRHRQAGAASLFPPLVKVCQALRGRRDICRPLAPCGTEPADRKQQRV